MQFGKQEDRRTVQFSRMPQPSGWPIR